MKKIIILGFIITFCFYKGQIGIGTTTPDPSAILDINVSSISPKKGFLLPRVNLTGNSDVSTIASPANGLMVYNKLTAGSGSTEINGRSVAVWDGSLWQSMSNLPEIRLLKPPVEFALSSKIEQNFTLTGELAAVNSATPVVVNFGSGDINIANPDDISLTGNTVKIITDSHYLLSGMISFEVNVATLGNASYIIIALQSSTDNGTSWNTIFGNSCPLERFATNKHQTVSIPAFIRHFSSNELLRMVIYKPASAENYTDNSGIVVNASGIDTTKSLRLMRIKQ